MPERAITGRCLCGALRYVLRESPLFTHACHCLDCQRRTGSAFAVTTFVMREDLVITHGRLSAESVSARSTVYSCPDCRTVIYIEATEFPSVILKPGTIWLSGRQAPTIGFVCGGVFRDNSVNYPEEVAGEIIGKLLGVYDVWRPIDGAPGEFYLFNMKEKIQ